MTDLYQIGSNKGRNLRWKVLAGCTRSHTSLTMDDFKLRTIDLPQISY